MPHPPPKNIRLPGYDYSRRGLYFVTICVNQRARVLSKIKDGNVILTDIGEKAAADWEAIPLHRPQVEVLDYVIMPDHIHGIVWIKEGADTDERTNAFAQPVSGSLSMIIGAYKAGIKRWCNQNGYAGFDWQKRFHDSIIWREENLIRVQNYIKNNPIKWTEKEEEDMEKLHEEMA